MSCVVHINGWPGCGKLTIAQRLKDKIGARLIDNHLIYNPASALFHRDDPRLRALRAELREALFAQALTLPAATPFIFTDALSDDPTDTAWFEGYPRFAATRGFPLVRVVLAIAEDENIRRLTSAGRTERLKLADTEILASLRRRYRLLTAPDAIELDVTALDPDQAADALATAISRHLA